jgi:uracil-DNA glycosylase
MDVDTLNSIFVGIDNEWKELLVRKLRTELTYTLTELNKLVVAGLALSQICPKVQNIFNFARITPYNNIKIILLGQDPYIGKDEAHGLSFSSNKNIPPSLAAIYNNLTNVGLIKNKQTSGNLEHWARQGVLLLNAALTTKQGTSNAHKDIWEAYTDKIISELSRSELKPIFILLGNNAIAKRRLISADCQVYTWGHPSPLNRVNKIECPANFKYCDAFKLAHEWLMAAGTEIIWDRVEYCEIFDDDMNDQLNAQTGAQTPADIVSYKPIELPGTPIERQHGPKDILGRGNNDTIYIFTDGGCTGNGHNHARSSYAFCIVTNTHTYTLSGKVELINIPGQKFQTSNNRGELFGVSYAFHYIRDVLNGKFKCEELQNALRVKHITVVSDSTYTIGCYSKWGFSWRKSGDKNKKNLDIIMPTLDVIDELKDIYAIDIKYKHIRSHKERPTDPNDLFYWYGNDVADKLCEAALKTI